jgi:hypothetical protein
MQLMKTFSAEQFDNALESWSFLDLDGKTPAFASLFGDVFLHSPDGWWFLDTLDGTLRRVWDTHEELEDELNTEDGQDRYLLGGLAIAAHERGVTLGDDEVYDFMPPPILGGDLIVDNIVAQNFIVAINLAGQIHGQVRDLPPGTPISGLKLA